jgi:hypothetical protein
MMARNTYIKASKHTRQQTGGAVCSFTIQLMLLIKWRVAGRERMIAILYDSSLALTSTRVVCVCEDDILRPYSSCLVNTVVTKIPRRQGSTMLGDTIDNIVCSSLTA